MEVAALPPQDLLGAPPGEGSEAVRARCAQARQRALDRQGGPNQSLTGTALDTHAALSPSATQFLRGAAQRLGWSARATHRVLRVARTIADLTSAEDVSEVHLAEAIQYRRSLSNAGH